MVAHRTFRCEAVRLSGVHRIACAKRSAYGLLGARAPDYPVCTKQPGQRSATAFPMVGNDSFQWLATTFPTVDNDSFQQSADIAEAPNCLMCPQTKQSAFCPTVIIEVGAYKYKCIRDSSGD
jgi:hypothetical protein